MKRTLQMVVLAALAAGSAQAADIRLGLNSSATLGCEVAGVRAGLQEGRFGGYVQGAYCLSNVTGRSGSGVFGGGLTFDLFQSPSAGAYALVGASTGGGGNGTVYGGLGARYGVPLLPFEAYVEGSVARTNSLLGPLTSPRLALGVNYVWRGVDLSQAAGASAGAGGTSRPSNISAPGVGGINVDQTGGAGSPAGGAAAPATCNVSPDSDAAAAQSVARAAATSALSAAATAYSAIYSNVSYDISVGGANISGNTATVTGTLTLRATNRANGQPVSGTYSGVVTLVRSGCSWTATGYRQNGSDE